MGYRVVRIKSGVAHYEQSSDTCNAQRAPSETTYLLAVAGVAFLLVLDRLDCVDTTARCSRLRASGLFHLLVAAAIFVYDLDAHFGHESATGEGVAEL